MISVKQKAIHGITVVGEGGTSPFKVIIKIFFCMKQMSCFGFEF